jgi:hypothetical protein
MTFMPGPVIITSIYRSRSRQSQLHLAGSELAIAP